MKPTEVEGETAAMSEPMRCEKCGNQLTIRHEEILHVMKNGHLDISCPAPKPSTAAKEEIDPKLAIPMIQGPTESLFDANARNYRELQLALAEIARLTSPTRKEIRVITRKEATKMCDELNNTADLFPGSSTIHWRAILHALRIIIHLQLGNIIEESQPESESE